MVALTNWLDRTMLIERLSGVAAYALLVIIVCWAIKSTGRRKNINLIFSFMLFVLTVMAFFYLPGEQADLVAWRTLYDRYWAGYSISEFIPLAIESAEAPLAYIIIFLCEKTKIEGLLPMVSAVFFYLFVFFIFKDSKFRFSFTSYSLSSVLFFFMASGCFLEVISGIRCFVAISITAFCMYKEMICGKKLISNIPLYVVASLVHLATIPLIAIRIVFLLTGQVGYKKPKPGVIILTFVAAFAGIVFGGKYIYAAFLKGSEYLSGDIYSYNWEYIIGFIEWIIITSILILFFKLFNKEERKPFNELARFCVCMSILEIILCFEYSIFHRFVLFSLIMIIPIACAVIDKCIEMKKYMKIKMFNMINLATLAIVCMRGNLCGYKFFLMNG